ncbi:MAG: hypothetical protein ISQ06_08800 [Planctomycetaceae bacterium]|nr:hypothetical protein [Planctomycetaceae bacterium]
MPECRVHLIRTILVHKIAYVVADDEYEARHAALCSDDGHDYCDGSAGWRRLVSVEELAAAESPAADM